MSDLAIATEALTKRYRGDVLAVDRVNLRVARGEIYAFLGLNGAGKSTTIRMLLGMIRPTAGHADLFGVRVASRANDLWRRVGHLVESATAYPELTVARTSTSPADWPASTTAGGRLMIDRLALDAYAAGVPGRCRSGTCSGWRSPAPCSTAPNSWSSTSLPTASTRPGSSRSATCCATWREQEGVTVFMSSHILGEVDLLANRIGIVHRGRLVEELDSAALEQRRDRRLEVGTRDLGAAETALLAAGLTPQSEATGDSNCATRWRSRRPRGSPRSSSQPGCHRPTW